MKEIEDSIDGNPSSTKIHIPPIFVHWVINYEEIIKRIKGIAEEEEICTIVWPTILLK